MYKRKEVSIVTREKRKARREKAKTVVLIVIFASTVGFVAGFKACETFKARYGVAPTVQVVQAQAVTTPAPAQSK